MQNQGEKISLTIPAVAKTDQSSEVALEAQPYSPNQIDEQLREIKELKNNIPPEKPKDNSLKPDDSKQAIMMLAICALCIIGAIATGGVWAQVIAVGAAATGLFGLKKAKDALFLPAPIEKKVKSAHEKAIDAKLKELENIVEFKRGFDRAVQGGAQDPDSEKRKDNKNFFSYYKTAVPALSPQEQAGFRQGQREKEQREQQLKRDQSGQQDTSLEKRIKGLEGQLSKISSQLSDGGRDRTQEDQISEQRIKSGNPQGLGVKIIDQYGGGADVVGQYKEVGPRRIPAVREMQGDGARPLGFRNGAQGPRGGARGLG